MTKIKFFLFFIVFTIGLSTFLTAQQCVESKAYRVMLSTLLSHDTPEICVDSLINLDSNTVFLDAREKAETNVSGIKNSIPVGYDYFKLKSVKHLPKNAKIVVYCSVGYRSEKIAEKLIKAGYTNVYNLYGGIFEWVNKGFPVYQKGQKTSKVHAYDKTWGMWLNKGEKVY